MGWTNIQDLAQLTDPDLFEQVSEGAQLCIKNAERLFDDADHLASDGRQRAAGILDQLADEEASKVLILVDAVRCPRSPQSEWLARQLRYFADHLAKGIYVSVCEWRPVDFAEVKRQVDQERRAFYLDGPNDIDWIFYNSILRRREEGIYVGYVDNDGTHDWHDPTMFDHLGVAMLRTRSSAFRVAHALSESGCLTAPAIAQIAAKWRPIRISDGMPRTELTALNHDMLTILKQSDLLSRSSGEHYGLIVDRWPFPLYPLDLGKDPVQKSSLRAIRDEYGHGGL